MGIFNTFQYSDGTNPAIPQTLYGNFSKLAFAVSPFTAVAITNNPYSDTLEDPAVDLSWVNPSGDIFGFRIVRNQEGFSETAEDGHIILETFDPVLPDLSTFTDVGYKIALTSGKYVYYTIWLLTADNSWYPAGACFTLIPKNHNMITPDGVVLQSSDYKMSALLPRAFTSVQKTPIDEIDRSSDLYNFLSGFAYTLDELLTYADLLSPSLNGRNNNPNFVVPFAYQLGLPFLPNTSIKTQKRLIRESTYLHKNKGTLLGISTFAEALTGFAPTVTVSPNLLLSIQDSTFYRGIGNWFNHMGGMLATIEASSIPIGMNGEEPYAVDASWHGVITTTDTLVGVSCGLMNPETAQVDVLQLGIPVKSEATYEFSFYSTYLDDPGSGSAGATPVMYWYDSNGNNLDNQAGDYLDLTSGLGTLQKGISSFTAPENSAFAGIGMLFNHPGAYALDMVQVREVVDTSVVGFHEARAAEIYLAPNKINWIENPSFVETTDLDDVDWVYGGADIITYITPTTVPGVKDGSHMVKLEYTTDPVDISAHTDNVPSDVYYTFSVYAKCEVSTATLSLYMNAVSGGDIVNINGQDVTNSSEITLTTSWNRYFVTLFVPDTGVDVHLEVGISGEISNKIYLDAAQAEQGYTPTDYFDGSYSARGASWLGDPDDSASYLYNNKIQKIGTLETQLPEYLPMNTAFVITTGFTSPTEVMAKGFSS